MTSLPIGDLELPLDEAVETLAALRAGTVDAIVVDNGGTPEVRPFRDPGHAYRILIECMNEGAALMTDGGDIVYGNRSLEHMLGAAHDGVIGKKLRDLVPASRSGHVDDILRMLDHEPVHAEIALVAADG